MTRTADLLCGARAARLVAVLMLCLFSPALWAACSYTAITPGVVNTTVRLGFGSNATGAALGGTIALGADLPVGSEIYRAYYMDDGASRQFRCTAGNYTRTDRVVGTLTPSGLTHPEWGPIYRTSHAGIGVIYTHQSNYGPDQGSYPWTYPQNFTGTTTVGYQLYWTVRLFKIGAIAAGTFNGSVLPAVEGSITGDGGPLTLWRGTVAGSFNIVTGTCRTPSALTYDLGTHHVSEMTGVGSYTDWVAMNIPLTNCPAFQARMYSIRTNQDGSMAYKHHQSNYVGVRVNPTTTVLDGSNGVMSIQSAAGSAQGVAIQIGLNYQDFWPAEQGGPLVFNKWYQTNNWYWTGDEGGSNGLLLLARYIQIAPTVRAGSANGQVIVSLTYN